MKNIKQIFTKIYSSGIKKLLFYTNPEFKMYEDILRINFLEIEHPKLNCWNSDTLGKYINFQSQITCKANHLLNNLISKTEYRSKINLKKIDSISASKSKSSGKIYENIYLFGQYMCVVENVDWTFDESINHILGKHQQYNKVQDIIYYSWNDRYHWVNSDGSHHLAVANFIATNERIDYFFDCNVTAYKINDTVAEELINNYELFILHQKIQYNFTKIFHRDMICILSNRNYDEVLIAIKKENTHINDVIRFLKKFDKKYVFNVNDYLRKLLQKQNKIRTER